MIWNKHIQCLQNTKSTSLKPEACTELWGKAIITSVTSPESFQLRLFQNLYCESLEGRCSVSFTLLLQYLWTFTLAQGFMQILKEKKVKERSLLDWTGDLGWEGALLRCKYSAHFGAPPLPDDWEKCFWRSMVFKSWSSGHYSCQSIFTSAKMLRRLHF